MSTPPLLNMTVLVTGAGGFIGKHVVRALVNNGARVRALTGPAGCGLLVPVGVESSAEFDIRDEGALAALLPGSDVAVHLAGPPSVSESFNATAAYVDSHVAGTASILKAIMRAGPCRLIYMSSAEIYGRPLTEYVSEEHPLDARSPYAACKIGAEYMISAFGHAYRQESILLRPFSVYGPGAPASSMISRVIQLARACEPIALRDLTPVRDYCYVEDLAQAVIHACMLPRGTGIRIFNIGTMRGTSVAEVARKVLNAMGLNLPIVESTNDRRSGESEIYRLVADNSLALASLMWSPTVQLEDGLRKTIAA
jgi:nucleoside-diphosphate-sugar epimerase